MDSVIQSSKKHLLCQYQIIYQLCTGGSRVAISQTWNFAFLRREILCEEKRTKTNYSICTNGKKWSPSMQSYCTKINVIGLTVWPTVSQGNICVEALLKINLQCGWHYSPCTNAQRGKCLFATSCGKNYCNATQDFFYFCYFEQF